MIDQPILYAAIPHLLDADPPEAPAERRAPFDLSAVEFRQVVQLVTATLAEYLGITRSEPP